MHTGYVEKKEIGRNKHSVWTLSGFRRIDSFILGRNYFPKSYVGFSLIELVIVVAVLGVLATGVILTINPSDQFRKARDSRRKSDLSQIQKAVETYYNDYGQYPENPDNDYRIIGGTDNDPLEWGVSTGWSYMDTLPKDPSSARKYVYCSPVDSKRQSYYLYASLESGGSLVTNNCGATTICGTGVPTCNYGVSSPNVSP